MNYFVRVIYRDTGGVQYLDVEASSEEEAVARFDGSSANVKIIRPDEMGHADVELIEHQQQQLAQMRSAATKANHRSLVLCLAFILFFAAMICWVIPAKTSSLLDEQIDDHDGWTLNEAEEAAWIEILLGR